MIRNRALLAAAGGLVLTAGMALAGGAFNYPDTFRGPVVDDYFGTKVADPYRWLEQDVRTSDSVASWVEAENKVTFGYLESIPERGRIKERLTALWNYERYSSPFQKAGRYYYFKNDGLQNQAVLYTLKTLDGEPELLLDPNKLSADGTVSLAGLSLSEDGRYMAYGLSSGGSDWTEWRVRELASGTDLPDHLQWIKFSGADWSKDSRGFYYSRFDEPDTSRAYTKENKFHKVFHHAVGTPQAQDRLVYERPDHPEELLGAGVTEDGQYLIISVSSAGENNLLYYLDLKQGGTEPVCLIDTYEAEYNVIGNDGPVFYIQTNWQAPKRRVVAVDTGKPAKENWKTVIPEGPDVMQGINMVNNQFIATFLKDACTRVRVFAVDGKPVRDVALPGIGSAGGFGGERKDTETFYSFSSYITPPSIFRLDMATGESRLMRQAKVDFNPADYEVKQVFYASKDGTKVPMFITHRKGLKLDGKNPTLLYGYGGFNISETPRFSVSRLAWLEMGGVLAVPNLRGGGEYGEEWHLAGTKLKKQNVFDDFIAAAEWLVQNGYTSPPRLAIQGGSNGGLLVGAVMTQRPDLFGACLPAVGVMDMLRYHKFTIGRAWAYDYGTSDDPAEFKALHAYSPLHRLTPGTRYPATLVTTADTDDRVVPAHSFKFAAALQRAQAGDAPALIRIETRAGHGGGKPVTKIIEETADTFAFLVRNLGVTLPAR